MSKRRIMRALKINEISAVDVPAQEGAVALIMKRGPVKKAGDLVAALTSVVDGHQHGISIYNYGDGVGLNVSGATSEGAEHSHYHQIARDASGAFIMSLVDGHTHELDQEGLNAAMIAFMTKADDSTTKAAGTPGNSVGNTEDPIMTDKTKAVEPTVADLQAQLARSNAIAEFTDAEKAHFKSLDDAGKDAFIAKSADDRKADVAKVAKAAQDEDPVVYTTKDGIELRKSSDPALVALAKSNDKLREDNAELRSTNEVQSLTKRAETELAHLPGTVEERAAMLKAIDAMPDEGQREASMRILKAQNEAMAGIYKTNGSGGSNPQAGSAEAELEALAKAHQEKHPELTIEAAYDAVMKTGRGAELYNKSMTTH